MEAMVTSFLNWCKSLLTNFDLERRTHLIVVLLPEWLQNQWVRQAVASLHKAGTHLPLEPWTHIHSNLENPQQKEKDGTWGHLRLYVTIILLQFSAVNYYKTLVGIKH
jgi:hypothetical protein